MRFCPFCAKENGDEAERCAHCGKKLPARRPPPAKSASERRHTSGKTLYGLGDAKAPPTVATPAPEPPPREPTPPPRKILETAPADKTAPSPLAEPEPPPVEVDHNLTAPSPKLDLDDDAPPPEPPPPARPAATAGTGVRSGVVGERTLSGTGPLTIPTPIPEPAPVSDTVQTPSPSVIVDAPSQPAAVPVAPLAAVPELSAPAVAVTHSQLVSVEAATPFDLAALPPMPPSPPSRNIWGAVLYLWPVARAWWARRQAQAKVRGLLVGDQRQLDQALGELGRAAREEALDLPALRDEVAQLDASEARRAKAAEDAAATEKQRAVEAEKFAAAEAKAQEALAEQDEVVRKADQALREQAERRRAEQQDLLRMEGEVRALDRKSSSLEARASKLPPTDPSRAEAELQAREARQRAAELAPQRDQAQARVQAMDAPIAQLTQALADARMEQDERKRALAAVVADRQHALGAIDSRLQKLAADQQYAASEITRRLVTLGTLLNLNRVDRPRFAPLYGRIDELKNGLTEREALMARLADERTAFDHAAVQKGLITVGAAVGALLIASVVLILVFAGGGHRCATAQDCRASELCLCDNDGCVDEKTFAARGRCVDRAEAERLIRRH